MLLPLIEDRRWKEKNKEKKCARVSFLMKLEAACNFSKSETLTQVFSCEFCEVFKNIFFYRTPLVAASVYLLWRASCNSLKISYGDMNQGNCQAMEKMRFASSLYWFYTNLRPRNSYRPQAIDFNLNHLTASYMRKTLVWNKLYCCFCGNFCTL